MVNVMNTNLGMYIINSMALLFLLYYIYNDKFLDKRRKRDFIYTTSFVILMMAFEFGTLFSDVSNANIFELNVLFNTLGFMMTPMIPILLMTIFDSNILKKYRCIFIPSIVNGVFSLLSPFLGLVFSISENNIYERGPLFLLFVIVYIINILLLVLVLWYNSNNRLQPIKWRLTVLSLFTILGTLIQIYNPDILSSWHIATLSLFVLYIILSDFEGSFDSLTQLHNRFAFEQASKRIVHKKVYTVISLDINHFKKLNDAYGHAYGDGILKTIASVILKSFDQSCDCFRIGGDEFCVLCYDLNPNQIDEIIETFNQNLNIQKYKGDSLPDIAIGYGQFNKSQDLDFKQVMKLADKRMYESKNKKNQFTQN